MPIGWFIVPYKRRIGHPRPIRYCAMDDYTVAIVEAGGEWAEIEVLGDRAIVKVSAIPAVLAVLNAVPGFKRQPKDNLADSLSSLSTGAKADLRNELQDAGYASAEIRSQFGNDLGQHALGDVLRFMASRRRKPRYDPLTDEIVLDGPEQDCDSIDDLDGRVN